MNHLMTKIFRCNNSSEIIRFSFNYVIYDWIGISIHWLIIGGYSEYCCLLTWVETNNPLCISYWLSSSSHYTSEGFNLIHIPFSILCDSYSWLSSWTHSYSYPSNNVIPLTLHSTERRKWDCFHNSVVFSSIIIWRKAIVILLFLSIPYSLIFLFNHRSHNWKRIW